MALFTLAVCEPADAEQVAGLKQPHTLVEAQAFTGLQFLVDVVEPDGTDMWIHTETLGIVPMLDCPPQPTPFQEGLRPPDAATLRV